MCIAIIKALWNLLLSVNNCKKKVFIQHKIKPAVILFTPFINCTSRVIYPAASINVRVTNATYGNITLR